MTATATPSPSSIMTSRRDAPRRSARRRVELTVERRRAQRLRVDPSPLVATLARARRILVVCHGNIIRSPLAARLIERLVADNSRALTVASAGLGAEPGRPSHTLAVEAAAPLRIDLRDHAAKRLTAEDVASADAIFVMDVEQRLRLRRRHPDAAAKTFLLASLAADTPLEVRDPVDGDAGVFNTCYQHISLAVQPLARALVERTT